MEKAAPDNFSLLGTGAITAPGDPPADHPLNGTLTHTPLEELIPLASMSCTV